MNNNIDDWIARELVNVPTQAARKLLRSPAMRTLRRCIVEAPEVIPVYTIRCDTHALGFQADANMSRPTRKSLQPYARVYMPGFAPAWLLRDAETGQAIVFFHSKTHAGNLIAVRDSPHFDVWAGGGPAMCLTEEMLELLDRHAARQPVPNVCAHCGRWVDGTAKCGRCRAAYYCDASCQRAAWSTHRAACGRRACC